MASISDKSVPGLLVAVLDPNRVVEARYLNYVVLTKNGLTHNGVLASETDASVTLLANDGKKQALLRRDIEEMASAGKSLMPEGLEKEIDPPGMADLFAYLRAAAPAPKPKAIAGNRPDLIRADAAGALLLTAKQAEIYCRSLTFEERHGNFGWWTSDDDRAVWSVELAKAGRYEVTLEWACDPASAGKAYLIDAAGLQLAGKVASTGNWDTSRPIKVGELVQPAGRQQIAFRSAGKLHSSDINDLRRIKLAPM